MHDPDNLAKIDRDRLTLGNDLIAAQIALDLHLVDLPLVHQHRSRQSQITIANRIDRAKQLPLDQATHRRERASD